MERLRPYLGEQSKKTHKYLDALAEGATPEKTNGWATGARQRASEARAEKGGEQTS